MSDQSLQVVVQVAEDVSGVPEEADWSGWVRKAVQAGAHDAAGVVTIRIVNSQESAALNENWRSKSGPTNVLAFPAPADDLPANEAEIGDLVVCLPVAMAEAAEQGKSLIAHLAHLVMHGTLHLLGFDHQHDAEAEQMESVEIELMQELGFEDPYAVR